MARRSCLVLPVLIGLWATPHVAPAASPIGRASGAPSPRTAVPVPQAGSWSWPVTGPVIRGFDPPSDPYGAGHRGVVTFSGKVGGQLFITLDHGDGLSSTYSWLSSTTVRKGDHVSRGGTIGATGVGHPGSSVTHLHFGVKLAGEYIDPMSVLGPLSVVSLIRLAPLV